MPSRQTAAALGLILHAAAAGVMAYGFLSIKSLPIDDWISSQKGGHYQYLTIQGLAAAWLTMIVSILCDILSPNTVLRRIKRALLMIALPLTVVISIVYWSLLLLFPNLILQKEILENEPSSAPAAPNLVRIPLQVDLSLHAAPFISMVADFALFEKEYTQRQVRYTAPFLILVFGIWYASCVEYCAIFNGAFPYPFLTENPLEIRIGIYSTVALLAWGCFRAINSLHPQN
ncbi:FAR-17a/AIG1-like protein [Hygrophoropsis aurantiaca]|uniref:FAR-17a/AIG1-like protein n=1 Tax=Hygrophoropsis aurantiaca TaxID=72124 RepID=A0ACB8ANY1_9AGAM|nr:FAR-17a/AIG1-like protein [Hygrophoropsis aurantiaca]